MMKKALPYTMGKAVCLWSGTAFYAVSIPTLHTRLKWVLTRDSEDEVSRKSISWEIRPMGLPCNLSSPGGMHQCDPVDGLLVCLRLCSRTHHLLVSLHYVCTLCMQFSATETSFQTPPARQRGEACDLVSARHRRHSLKVIVSCHPRYPQGLLEICIAVAGLFDYFGPSFDEQTCFSDDAILLSRVQRRLEGAKHALLLRGNLLGTVHALS